MKRIALYFGMVAALVASCSTREMDFQTLLQEDVEFYASFEQPSGDGTRVYANEDLLLRWTADDRISIFNKSTYNQQYQFIGETGDYEGGFNKVGDPEFITGDEIPHVVSVYPFQRLTRVSAEEVVTVTLPSEQSYAQNSFGLGANTMVSVSSGNLLKFRNVGGYLMLKLYGEGVSVSSIVLKGNNGEKLAGDATITMPLDGVPTAVMANDAMTEITLTCPEPVALGATAEESTPFWFVVPPVIFNNGFTIKIKGTGYYVKSTEKVLSIERNRLSKMSPIKVDASIENNCIVYTSSDRNVINPTKPDAFGATIVSNEYYDGVGIITFDGDISSIGGEAFSNCASLTSITIPDSVMSIGIGAFNNCPSLTSITIPDSVMSIGDHAFGFCTSLTSITIPDSVMSIGHYAFSSTSLTSITIPNSVTSIGVGVFRDCFSMKSFQGKFASSDGLFLIDSGAIIAVAYAAVDGVVTIPDSVTSIGNWAFYACNSLLSVTIPDSVTSIGKYAFSSCTSLPGVTIPDSVTSIGDYAFSSCVDLTNITIPDSVKSIGYLAFNSCTGLTSITVLPEIPPLISSSFEGTNDCPIYVPAGSVDAYKSAESWFAYSDRIHPQYIPLISIDGQFDDWAALNTNYFVSAKNNPDSPWNAVNEIRCYADSYNVFYYIEYNEDVLKEQMENGSELPLRICLNTDGEFTSGYHSFFLDGYDFITEGVLADGAGAWCTYDCSFYQRVGSWVELLTFGSNLVFGKGFGNKYEIMLNREVFNSAVSIDQKMGDVFYTGLRFYGKKDLNSSTWNELSNLPNSSIEEEQGNGWEHLMKVTTVK